MPGDAADDVYESAEAAAQRVTAMIRAGFHLCECVTVNALRDNDQWEPCEICHGMLWLDKDGQPVED